jgi:pyruvate formate lyase activating enzyme
MLGRDMTVDQLVGELLKDRPFYEQSGGGVTFSGGEPLLQRDFLLACLRACRKEGLHTAVDTSGFAPRDQMLELALWTDLILFDLKFIDNARHIEHTGVPVLPILKNLDALDAAGAGIWVRLPLIPGVNDDGENLNALAGVVSDLDHTRRIHILPYHATGRDKYARLGRVGPSADAASPSHDCISGAAKLLAGYGLDVHVGG